MSNSTNEDKSVGSPANDHDHDDSDHKRTAYYLMSSPAYLSSIVRRQVLKEMLKSYPENMQARVKALKNVQLDYLKMEAKFYEEVYQLERKYQDLYQPLHDKRKAIVNGEYEPTEKECEWKSDDEDEEMSEKSKEASTEIKEDVKKCEYAADVKGIPDFWFVIFRSTELLSSMLQECDEPLMKKLTDVKIKYEKEPMAYTLEFYFAPNEYFTNSVLTKKYFLKSNIDADCPFTFEGPEIYRCTGCTINWNKGMNLTVKTIRKKQKHKARGAIRTITKQVPADTFFNFFNPPQLTEDVDNDDQQILGTDFEIGHFLRARVIPKAVLYYAGDLVEDDEDEFDEEEEEEEEDDGEEESDMDEDHAPASPAAGKKSGGKKAAAVGAANPSECQQQ